MITEGRQILVAHLDFASPVWFVYKKDGSIRVVVDFKEIVNPKIKQVVSDNGPLLILQALNNFVLLIIFWLSKSPPYHPQSNGLAERRVKTGKVFIKKLSTEHKGKVTSKLCILK